MPIGICFYCETGQIRRMQNSENIAAPETSRQSDLDTTSAKLNPALEFFLNEIGERKEIAQLLVQRRTPGADDFEFRHLEDEKRAESELETVLLDQAQFYLSFNDQGAFRPIKGAPDMRHGWRLLAKNAHELELALQAVYPGLIADYYAVHQMDPIPVTSYDEFAGRQTGMYRNAKNLKGDRAAQAVQTACGPSFCMKRRYWTVPGLDTDSAEVKSEVPCLEPCAVMLEWGRKVVRMDQIADKCVESGAEPMTWTLTPDEAKSLQAAIDIARKQTDPAGRTADVASPLNPRRLEWVSQTLNHLLEKGAMRE